jgi:predicted nucleic acid-binding protein
LEKTDVPLQRTEVVISAESPFQALVKALSLDLGEQAALTLMSQHPQAIFLTDDAAARLAAVTLGYRVHGAIGVLLRAIRRQQRTRDEVLTILHELPQQSTLYLRASLLQDIITRLKSQP